jgi:glucuronokinase
MQVIRHRVYARAGLIGNPSDGFNGRTISFLLRNFSAQVVLYPWDRLEILWSQQDKNTFASLEELAEDVARNGYYGGVRLVKATIKKFHEFCRTRSIPLRSEPFSIRYETDIPRGVGLAGSSAIVVATLAALVDYYGVEIPLRVMPSLARSVENDELGIACGLQDRVIQVYGGVVAMDFSSAASEMIGGYECGRYDRLDAAGLPSFYIACDPGASKVSGTVIAPLRDRVAADPKLAAVMREIADLVPPGVEAIKHRDHATLSALVNRNFDLRTRLYTIPERQRKMVDVARSTGASASFAGSGGTIVGAYADDEMFAKLSAALSALEPRLVVLKADVDTAPMPVEP